MDDLCLRHKFLRDACRFSLVSSALILLSCGPPEPSVKRESIVEGVCDFDRVAPNSITAYQDVSGTIVYGDVSNQAVLVQSGIWSAIYATRQSLSVDSETRVGQHCAPVFVCNYFGQCGYVPQCTPYKYKEDRYTDISHLYGIGRAQSREEAEDLALMNCESAVRAFEDESGEYISYREGECIRRITQFCG